MKDINNLVNLYTEMGETVNTDLNYLILLMLLIIFCVNTPKNERVMLIGRNNHKLLSNLCN